MITNKNEIPFSSLASSTLLQLCCYHAPLLDYLLRVQQFVAVVFLQIHNDDPVAQLLWLAVAWERLEGRSALAAQRERIKENVLAALRRKMDEDAEKIAKVVAVNTSVLKYATRQSVSLARGCAILNHSKNVAFPPWLKQLLAESNDGVTNAKAELRSQLDVFKLQHTELFEKDNEIPVQAKGDRETFIALSELSEEATQALAALRSILCTKYE